MNLAQAVAYLDDHWNLEKMLAGERATAPTLERIRELFGLLGDPERQFPIVHVTGTNGKTSTSRAISRLLAAHDLSIGTYTSPHLTSVTERMLWNGEPISDDAFAGVGERTRGARASVVGAPDMVRTRHRDRVRVVRRHRS